ncbi:nickel transporter [Streptomyces sp. MZ04]|uniref:nickel/cobalt transporter n=1 Tax=Streptomyces sp. MZ04 TaxID=2559236 RepID=UPI00107E86A7|nr:nickel transporter [Streptomyces sp. MZ04]TGA98787.1 nickel transporter [Streptomyces sp. MZ04]
MIGGAALLALLPAGQAAAHPLGNFTVNRYDGIVVAPGRVTIDHVEDLAEIPATQAMPRIKETGMAAWAEERCGKAARGSRLRAGGETVPLRVARAGATARDGQAGLRTLRVRCELGAPLPRDTGLTLRFEAAGQPGPGWREITAQGDRMTVRDADVPETSVSRRLTRYPQRLLSSPPRDESAALRITPGGPALGAQPDPEAPATTPLPRGADRWTQALTGLVARHDLSFGFAVLALGIALSLGSLHAIAPGHGKTLMAASAAARGHASLRDVLPLAASVTVTHTLGVAALGLLVAGGSAAAPSVIAWLGIASGVLVTGAGALLLRRAWRRRRHHGHSHQHGHGHQHHEAPPRIRGALFLGFAGGLVPSPSAVVVLVGASALGEAWFGLLLVLAYGTGLAVTLTAAGFLVVRVGSAAGKRLRGPRWLHRATHRLLPVGSACVVVALGCGLVFKGAATALG